MLDDGEIREDLKLPEGELGKDIAKRFDDGESLMVSFCVAVVDKRKSHWSVLMVMSNKNNRTVIYYFLH